MPPTPPGDWLGIQNANDLALLNAAGATAADAPALQALAAAGATAASQPGLVAYAAAKANIGAPDTAYTASVAGSSVGQAMSDLEEFGLSGAAANQAISWYNTEITKLASPAQMQIDMYQQPWFQGAFPGIIQQIKNGQSPMSPQDYITFKQGVKSFSAQFGLPQGFVTDNDIANMVGKGMTFDDFTQRVGLAFNASANAAANNPDAVALLDKWYGIKPGSGALAAFYLDPTRAVSTLAQATTAAQAGASAEKAGFTALSQADLMSLAANKSLADIQSGIAAAVPLLPTTRATVTGVENTDQRTLLAAQTGGIPGETQEQAQGVVNRVVGERTAEFHGGGGEAGQGQVGTTGVGFGVQ